MYNNTVYSYSRTTFLNMTSSRLLGCYPWSAGDLLRSLGGRVSVTETLKDLRRRRNEIIQQ